MAFRLIHSSDLHLGKRFGQWPEDVRGRLREARHAVLDRLAQHAHEQGADVILLAGDSFDTETPSAEIRRQALGTMRDHAPLRWVVLPGNHDSLQAVPLWASLAAEAPANVTLTTSAAPMDLAPGVALLPAPCTTRRPGRDLTEWMVGAATPEGTIRIGLAHGAVTRFSEEDAASDVIPPDRATSAGLDYLALGDWHGTIAIDRRTHYSGSPEPDRFKHDAPGQALFVTIDGPGAVPAVTALETGRFAWRMQDLRLLPGEDGCALFADLLPPGPARRQTLLRLSAMGRTSMAARTALEAAVVEARPEFAALLFETDGLSTDCEADDLDLIDRVGALRQAAEALRAESLDPALPAQSREVARAALVRLFTLAQAAAS